MACDSQLLACTIALNCLYIPMPDGCLLRAPLLVVNLQEVNACLQGMSLPQTQYHACLS